MTREAIRRQILDLVRQYHEAAPARKFTPGVDVVHYSGRNFDDQELMYLVGSSLDFWLTAGRYAKEFENNLAQWLGAGHVLLTNSGSSANLLAVSALTSPKLKDRRIQPGDEVITVATGFPTTVNPIIQNRAVPVFVDVDLGTYVPSVDSIEAAISPRTRAVMMAHTMGVPFAAAEIRDLCDSRGLWLIEDNCDALGSVYDYRQTGTFGDLATISFYPAHHITMGEGGAVVTGNEDLARIVASFRDWGRTVSALEVEAIRAASVSPSSLATCRSDTIISMSTAILATILSSQTYRQQLVSPNWENSTRLLPPAGVTIISFTNRYRN